MRTAARAPPSEAARNVLTARPLPRHCAAVLWRDAASGTYHALFHGFESSAPPSPPPPQTCAGALVAGHAFSADGRNWTRSATPPFGNTYETDDGRLVVVATRERPKLVLDAVSGAPIALFTAASSALTCPPAPCVACKMSGWSYTLAQETAL